MNLTDFSVSKASNGYVVKLRTFEREVTVECTPFLGSIMTAFGMALRTLYSLPESAVTPREGTIPIQEFTISPLPEICFPSRWMVRMRSGPYRYEAEADDVVEHLILLFEGAMKFFAFKHKLTTLEPDLAMNREHAARLGLLTREDG